MSGWDCNDADSNIFGEINWFYDEDGDGYHGQKITSCTKPTSGLSDKWLQVTNGPDCDDSDVETFVLNACGICSSTEHTVAYVDFDLDGYRSLEIVGLCANSEFVQFRSHTFRDTDIFKHIDSLFSPVPVGGDRVNFGNPDEDIFYEVVRLDSVRELSCGTPLRTDGGLCPNWYFTEVYHLNVSGTQHLYSDGSDFFFIGTRESRFLRSTTLGEDCDDLNRNVKAYGDWYFDGDYDEYHNTDTVYYENTCSPPISNQWILLDNSKGPDCNDDNKNETELITWYFDNDQDEYYSTTQQGCENPAKGTGDEAKWRRDPGNGPDCFDDDREANDADRIWYYDFDGDNYYGVTTTSCQNPAIDTPESELWKPDPGEGEDCDDNDPESQTFNTCGVCGGSDDPSPQYIDIDGDGYHSVYKFEDCGLNEFSRTIMVNGLGDFVSGAVHGEEITFPAELSHLQGLSIQYDDFLEMFTVPEAIISSTTLGLDCDDFSAIELSNGEWYPDVDGDGYHDDTVTPVPGCCPPNASTYILLTNSLGPDCNDEAQEHHTNSIWYLDDDGDGYYADSQVSCEPPGFHWKRMSGIGFDDDDNNPFSPALVPPSQEEIFSIPSIIDIVGEAPYEQLEYNGNLYDPSQISIFYRGVTFTYDDLIFERASPEITLKSNSLLIPEGHPLMGAVIKISGEPVQTLAVRSETTYSDTGDNQDLRPCNEWTEQVRQLYPGYNSVCGDLTIDQVTESGNYFDELFDPTQFQVFKSHYDTHGHPPFGIKFQSFVETLNADLKVEPEQVINETIGPESEIGIIVTARKTVGGTIEYVVSVRDETFEPTDAALQREGWKDANGNWTGDLDQAKYSRQLSEMQQFRKLMPGVLALDYSTIDAIIPISPTVSNENGLPDLPPEEYPLYNYGNWGFLTKLIEFYEVGYHVSHEFKVPDGIWDPAAKDYDRWRAKSPASVSGAIDASIRELRDLADMVKLAQSLCYKKTWEQILESVKNFNVGEQVRAMISSFDEEIATLQGDNGRHKQYYTIAGLAVVTVSAIYAGWKAVGKIAKKLSKVDPENPVSKLDQKNIDFQDVFSDKINKSPQFSGLSKELQEQLTDDLARLKDHGVFARALAENPELVKSWVAVQDLHISIKSDVLILERGGDLIDLGFENSHFRTLATLQDANALSTAKRLRINHVVDGSAIDFENITDMIDNSYLLGDDFITSLDNISAGPGKLLDPSGLQSKLSLAVSTNNRLEGIRLTMDDAGLRIKKGNNVEIENIHADLEDFTLKESVQHKLMTGGNSQLATNINKAVKQLRGEFGEVPQFQKKIVHLEIWETSSSIYKNYTRQELFEHISDFDAVNYNLNGATQLIIENTIDKHVFNIIDGVLQLN